MTLKMTSPEQNAHNERVLKRQMFGLRLQIPSLFKNLTPLVKSEMKGPDASEYCKVLLCFQRYRLDGFMKDVVYDQGMIHYVTVARGTE